ncbi:hypothetical protein P350_13285 [Burkholderia cepacia JBK9]|nr:hypothetical protein P350_13285 [Burkholderia cepacia JBK9]
MKRSRQQVIHVTDDPKKAAATARSMAEYERRHREQLEAMRGQVEAISGAADKASEPENS